MKAIAFQPALLERPEPLQQFLILQLSDGSRLRAASWKGGPKNIQVRTAGGANALTFNIASKGSATQKQIVGLLPIGFESVFLSDLKEAAYQHHPFLSLHWPYRRDRSVLGERLQTQSKLYEKGIGMHTDAELTFRLEQPFKRLDGAVGIDDSAEEQGSVIFEVDVQRGDTNWNTAFKSRMLRGGEPAEPFSVDLEGVKGIRLKAGHAADGERGRDRQAAQRDRDGAAVRRDWSGAWRRAGGRRADGRGGACHACGAAQHLRGGPAARDRLCRCAPRTKHGCGRAACSRAAARRAALAVAASSRVARRSRLERAGSGGDPPMVMRMSCHGM